MIAHQQQPTDKTCGQAVLAMLRGVPVTDVIAELGGRATRPSQLANYLHRYNWIAARKLRRCRTDDVLAWTHDEPTILRVHWRQPSRITHWVLRADSKIYDPQFAVPSPSVGAYVEWLEVIGARFTSFLALVAPDGPP